MQTCEVKEIVGNISYKPGWTVVYHEDKNYIQLECDERSDATLDSVKRDGTRVAWKSGKRYLSSFMCRQEIVGVIFDLIKSAEMHEVHEWFRYKNASIFNPHLDPDALVEVARKKKNFCVREDSMVVA